MKLLDRFDTSNIINGLNGELQNGKGGCEIENVNVWTRMYWVFHGELNRPMNNLD